MKNSPSTFVADPCAVPFMITFPPIRGSLDFESIILPCKDFVSCDRTSS